MDLSTLFYISNPNCGLKIMNRNSTGAYFYFRSANRLWQMVVLAIIFMSKYDSTQAQRFTGKIIAGINGAQIDGDGFSGFNYGGFMGGAGAAFQLNEEWSIGPEILYSMKGSRTTLEQMDMGLPRIIYRLNYVDVPIILTYKVRESFRCMAGLGVNYLITAKIDNGSNLGFVDSKRLFRDFDYQCSIGMEYEVFDAVWIQGRWSYSMVSTNAVGTQSIGFPSVTGMRGGFFNNLLQFSLRFDLMRGEAQSK